MKTLVLSVQDLRALVRQVGLNVIMDELIERLEEAIRTYDSARTEIPVREGFHYRKPQPGLLEWMPIRNSDQATIKVVAYHPDSPANQGLPTVLSSISAYETGTGHLLGIVDGTLLTALRTGAASAIASRILAAPQSRVLGLIGCGAQAVSQLHALSRIFPIEQVLIHDTDVAVARSFGARAGFVDAEISIVPVEQLVGAADIVCTATSVAMGEGPVFADQLVQPWLHVNAVGSDFPGKVELPRTLLERSFVTADFPEQAAREGECQQLDASAIGPPLAEVVREASRFEAQRQQLTVFDSTGWALEDQVAMELIMSHARRFDLGAMLEIESISLDPHDPYQFLKPARVKRAARVKGEIVA